MCNIYANAVLTISASDSKDCRDGFLIERSAPQQEGAVLTLLGEEGEVRSQLHLMSISSAPCLHHCLRNSLEL